MLYLKGDNPKTVELGSAYTEDGVIASFNMEDLTIYVTYPSSVSTSKLGTQKLKYILNYNGTKKSITRTLKVVDTTKQIITGATNVTITSGSKFNVLEGINVTDNSGEVITPSVTSNLITDVVGTYKVTYKAIDSSKNVTIVQRTISVVKSNSILKEYNHDSIDDFNSDDYRNNIISVKFVNYLPNKVVPMSWDLSSNNDNSIIGWLEVNKSNNEYYDMYVV